KVLHPEVARDADVARRFYDEARAANAVRHPGVVQVFDFGVLPTGAPYLVMEMLEGESLAACLERSRPLPVGEAIDIACQAANVLAAVHDGGIVHRDLKPGNLFLAADYRAARRV